VDRLISEFDRALRAVAGVAHASRPSPAEGVQENSIREEQRMHAAALMRVNHVGEVCAQALYQGQALTARDPVARQALEQAAREEESSGAPSASASSAGAPAC
jgi:ubiquinone biosynthesis monooxygenase Coq7